MLIQHYITLISVISLSLTIIGALILFPLLTTDHVLDVKNQTKDVLQVDGELTTSSLKMVRRSEWLAQPAANELVKIHQPVPWVIITHTATESCHTQTECVERVRMIQTYHQGIKIWDDIGYNFLIGGDGSAYFGRGWDYIGAYTDGYNHTISISFIGTFDKVSPSMDQLDACQELLELGVKIGKLTTDYKLFTHRQLTKTFNPGDKVYDIIKTWPHFVYDTSNITDLIPKD